MRSACGFWLTLWLVACSKAAGVRSTVMPDGANLEIGQPRLADTCGPAITNGDVLVGHSGLVVLGEMHGTAEAPAFVGDLACRAAMARLPVSIGLEFDVRDQPLLEAYLRSNGTQADRTLFLAAPSWAFPDGRGTEARMELVEQVRKLKGEHLPIDMFFFDGGDSRDRESGMATNILARRQAHPTELTLVLVGNYHARTVTEKPVDPTGSVMGAYLIKADPALLSLSVSYNVGEAWVCMVPAGATKSACGVHSIGFPPDRGEEWEVNMYPQTDDHGFNGGWHIGTPTASPPVVQAVP